KTEECANLLVPVCMSATHIAYGSIRMEPVYMILGQACGTAAAMAVDAGTAVQAVPYAKLRERLVADKQLVEWTGPVAAGESAAEAGDRAGLRVAGDVFVVGGQARRGDDQQRGDGRARDYRCGAVGAGGVVLSVRRRLRCPGRLRRSRGRGSW